MPCCDSDTSVVSPSDLPQYRHHRSVATAGRCRAGRASAVSLSASTRRRGLWIQDSRLKGRGLTSTYCVGRNRERSPAPPAEILMDLQCRLAYAGRGTWSSTFVDAG